MLRAVKYWKVECDWPECGVDTGYLGDYGAYSDSGSAEEEWIEHDGVLLEDPDNGELHFCSKHAPGFCVLCNDLDAERVLDGKFVCEECYEDQISMVG